MYYKNKDYTIRMENVNDHERYFIKFHSQIDMPEIEVQFNVFLLYTKEFNKPLERQKNEERRHLESREINSLIISNRLTSKTFEEQCVDATLLETILHSCTEIQQRRFKLYYEQGYSFEEIAQIENCGKQRIKKSVDVVSEKIKNFFS